MSASDRRKHVPNTTLEHAFTLAASPSAVLALLAEPASYVGLTPFVTSVRDVREVDGVTHYTAVERFVFLKVVKHDNPIAVTLVVDTSHPVTATVGGEVVSPGWVRMTYRYTIAPDPVGASLVDTLHLRAPLGLLRFARAQARAAQLYRAEELARRLG
jgi:hypothetical protein